jgi:hypothetical protein
MDPQPPHPFRSTISKPKNSTALERENLKKTIMKEKRIPMMSTMMIRKAG